MKLLFTSLLTIVFLSCGQSTQEKEALQKAREDSIKTVTELATRLRIEKIQSLKDFIAQMESEKNGLDNLLTNLKAELEVAKDKLITIKQYQFLRTSSEREVQVRNQTLVIDQLEKEIAASLLEIAQHEEIVRKTKSELKNYESPSKN